MFSPLIMASNRLRHLVTVIGFLLTKGKQLNKGLCCDYTEDLGTARLYKSNMKTVSKN